MVVEVVHPWPEWIELMERLVGQNYFDHRRKDEDRMVKELGFRWVGGSWGWRMIMWGLILRISRPVHTACVNFRKDRFDIMRFVVVLVFLLGI
uniref:Uncharacterized protein n=1 Tax=Fagus sylvatica TaxID=28930 RepID=A0A2N9IV18_FAGSY